MRLFTFLDCFPNIIFPSGEIIHFPIDHERWHNETLFYATALTNVRVLFFFFFFSTMFKSDNFTIECNNDG